MESGLSDRSAPVLSCVCVGGGSKWNGTERSALTIVNKINMPLPLCVVRSSRAVAVVGREEVLREFEAHGL